MILTIHLPDDLEQRLRERASRSGQAIEDYLLSLIERDAALPRPGGETDLTDNEFQALLDELAAGPALPRLPADFSRADIYADHD